MKTLILELPGLLDEKHSTDMSHPIEVLDLPLLSLVLSKADRLKQSDFSGRMLSALEAQGEVNPRWAVDYLKLADDSDSYKYWLRADPVELQTDISAVYLKGNRHLKISDAGLNQIKQCLQQCFEEGSFKFCLVSETEGYLGFNENYQVNFVSFLKSLSKNQLNALPTGKDVPFWSNLLAEIQMSLFGNTAPSEAISESILQSTLQTKAVNSIYFWGDATASVPELSVGRLISDSNLLLGLGVANKITVNKRHELSTAEIIESITANNPTQIVDMELLWLQKQGLVLSWQEKINQLEKIELPKIINGLKKKQLDELLIVTSNKTCFRLRGAHLKRFWRRHKKINHFLEKTNKE